MTTIEAIVVAIATLGGWMTFTKADDAHKALRNAGHVVSRQLVRDAWKVRTITKQEMELVVPTLADDVKTPPATIQPPKVVEGGKTRKSGRTTISDDDLFQTCKELRAGGEVTSAMKAIRHLRSNGISASQARVHAAWQATAPEVVSEEE